MTQLVLGIGGGSDAIGAYAIACHVGGAYGNTKHALDDDLERVSPNIGRIPLGAPLRGTTKIERRLPRGPHDSPLVLALARDAPLEPLAAELAALAFERIIAVDTGGDALDDKPGRDRRMLDVIRLAGIPSVLVVLAPGSDGQQSRDAIEATLRRRRCLCAFSIAPLVPILRSHGQHIGPERTPNIICRAFDDELDPVEIPRGKRPRIPRHWLRSALVFALTT